MQVARLQCGVCKFYEPHQCLIVSGETSSESSLPTASRREEAPRLVPRSPSGVHAPLVLTVDTSESQLSRV